MICAEASWVTATVAAVDARPGNCRGEGRPGTTLTPVGGIVRLVLSVVSALCSEVKSPAMVPSVLIEVLMAISWLCSAVIGICAAAASACKICVEIQAGEIGQGY